MEPLWAACPRIEDRERPDKPQLPIVFESEKAARRFLNSLVRWPKERIQQREDALAKYKSGDIRDPHFPQHLIRRRNGEDGWEGPFPVVGINTQGAAPAKTFELFLPLSEVGDVPERALDDMINRIFEGRGAHYRCLLSPDWDFTRIEDDMWNRTGHLFEGRKYDSIAQIVVKAVYDAQAGLAHLHPGISGSSVSDFFICWQFWRHLAEFCQRVGESTTGTKLAGDWTDAKKLARASFDWICEQLAAYSYELNPWPLTDNSRKERTQRQEPLTRAKLRDFYFGQFAGERIVVLDLCWAAGQHYSEWKRWLRGPRVLKDGSAPDRAFRAILASRKRPSEYRKGKRPSGWT